MGQAGVQERSMRTLLASVIAAALAGGLIRGQQFPPGYVDPLPLLAAAAREIGEANLRCITFSGTGYNGAVGQTVRVRPEHRLAAHRRAGQLHADHQLGNRHEQGDLRSQAGAQSGGVEVRLGLAGRHADPETDATDAHRATDRTRGHIDGRAASRSPCRLRMPSAISWTCG